MSSAEYSISNPDENVNTEKSNDNGNDIAPLPENAESDTEYSDDYAPISEELVLNEASNPLNNFVLDIRTGTNTLM